LIPRKRRVVIVSLAILLLLGLFWARTVVKAAIVLGLLGVFLADVIAPPVEALRRRITIGPRRRALPRGLAIGLVYVALAASAIPLALATPRLERQMSQLRHHAPEYLAATGSRIRAAGRLYRHYPVPIQIEAAARTLGARGASFVQRHTREGLNELEQIVRYLPWLAIVPVLAFFLLTDAPAFRRSALRALPHGHLQWRGTEILRDANTTLAAYIRSQLLAALIAGTLCGLGFAALGVPYALLLGVAAAALELLPLIGPMIVAVAASTVTPDARVLVVLAFLVAVRIVQDQIIFPRVMGRRLRLHPLAVILAVWAGAELGGIAGVFIAIPIVAFAAMGVRHWREYRDIEHLLAQHDSNAPPAPQTR